MTKKKANPMRPWAQTAPLDRVMRKIRYDHGCWLWAGTKAGPSGWNYGRVTAPGGKRLAAAHRVVYEMLVGPIPAGLVLDHLCRNPACVNPLHLEPVTSEENTRRGASCRHSATSCTKGHEFTEENTGSRWYGGREWRYCKACARERSKDARAEGRWTRLPWSERSDNGRKRAA